MKLKCLRNRKPFLLTDLEDTSTDITFNLTWKESGLELMSVYGKLSYELDIVGINRDLFDLIVSTAFLCARENLWRLELSSIVNFSPGIYRATS